jgi:quercetin dioxygenase-like cupin family protein
MASDPQAGEQEEPDGFPPDPVFDESGEPAPYFVEVWNDYDPSMRFAVIFPLAEDAGAESSSVAYSIIEPGKHTGLHNDSAEEVVFVAEGAGEVFSVGQSQRLEAGQFLVFTAGTDHDIYSQGDVALRLLSFFPAPEVISTFQQVIYPMGGNELSSRPPKGPVITELDPNNLPEDFPFDLSELGLGEGGPGEPRELTMTERLIGMTSPDDPPPSIGPENVLDPRAPGGDDESGSS